MTGQIGIPMTNNSFHWEEGRGVAYTYMARSQNKQNDRPQVYLNYVIYKQFDQIKIAKCL